MLTNTRACFMRASLHVKVDRELHVLISYLEVPTYTLRFERYERQVATASERHLHLLTTPYDRVHYPQESPSRGATSNTFKGRGPELVATA